MGVQAYHYFSHKEALQSNQTRDIPDRTSVLSYLNGEDPSSLEEMGFDKEDIQFIQDDFDLPFKELIISKENAKGLSIAEEDIQPYEFTLDPLHTQQAEGDHIRFEVSPTNSQLVTYEDGEKTIYSELLYTVHLEEPLFFQSEDRLEFMLNNWFPVFHLSALHYKTKDGKEHTEYKAAEKHSRNNELTFTVKQKLDGETYYLSHISGLFIIESFKHLNLHLNYSHDQLIINPSLGSHSGMWVED